MRPFLRACITCAAIGMCTAIVAPAYAEDAAVDAVATRQRELYDQGNKLYDQKKFPEAEAAYLAAWKVKKGYDLAANLGDVELLNGKSRLAAEHLSYALREFPAGGKPALRQQLSKRLAEARQLVLTLHIEVNKPGAEVFVDGQSIGRAPIVDDVFVDPVGCTVEAKLDGFVDGREAVPSAKGGAANVKITLVPKPERRSIVPAVVLGGVAVVGLASGIGLLAAGGSKRSSAETLFNSILGDKKSCVPSAANFDARCTQLSEISSSSDTLHNVGVGMLIGGGAAALATGAYLFWPASKAPTTGSTLRVIPVVAETGGAILATGTF
jgi:PEGA domain-containing protein